MPPRVIRSSAFLRAYPRPRGPRPRRFLCRRPPREWGPFGCLLKLRPRRAPRSAVARHESPVPSRALRRAPDARHHYRVPTVGPPGLPRVGRSRALVTTFPTTVVPPPPRSLCWRTLPVSGVLGRLWSLQPRLALRLAPALRGTAGPARALQLAPQVRHQRRAPTLCLRPLLRVSRSRASARTCLRLRGSPPLRPVCRRPSFMSGPLRGFLFPRPRLVPRLALPQHRAPESARALLVAPRLLHSHRALALGPRKSFLGSLGGATQEPAFSSPRSCGECAAVATGG